MARSVRRTPSQSQPLQTWLVAADERRPTSAPAILEAQQTAGNRATTALVRRIAAGTVQRDHSDATSGGATTKTGVTVPKSGNWNAQDLVIGAVRRKPIEGLTTGNVRGDAKLGEEWGGEGLVKTITGEKAEGKAIVLLPEPLGAAVKSVDVMIYLHGFGIGFRQRIHSRQKTIKVRARKKKGDKEAKDREIQVDEPGMEQGTVRDIEVDHMEEQLEAVNAAAAREGGRPMIAVMPQGTYTAGKGRPQFGEKFLSEAYLDDVWGKIPALKGVARGRAVLAGHSGAGGTLTPLLGRAVDDKGELKGAAEAEAGGLPKNLAEVVLFDALNSEGFYAGQRDQVERWLIAQIRKDLRTMADPSIDRDAYLRTQMVRFRGYYSQGSDYETRYKHLKENVAAALTAELAKAEAGKKAFKDRPAVPGWSLTAAQKQAMTDNYVDSIQGVATSHEKIMGQGKVREALGALPVQKTQPVQKIHAVRKSQAHDRPASSSYVIQREPTSLQRAPTPDPDLAQWTADWNDAQFAGARRYFSETTRPSGTPEDRYKILCPLYKAHGIARPLPYLKNSINGSTTFFGQTTPAHTGMQAMLAAAEKTLRELKDDKGNPRYPTTPLKQRPWALTVRTTSSNKWSNHADGRAIDLDPDTNPHLDNAEHRAIINELTGMNIEARNPGAALPLPPLLTPDSYDSVKMISEQFSANYTEAALAGRSDQLAASRAALVTERDGMKTSRADLAKQAKDVAKQRDLAVGRKGATVAEKTAAREQAKSALKDIAAKQAALKGQLAAKDKEVDAMTKRANRIAAELRKFTREQKRFDATVAAVAAAEAAIGTDSTDLATATAAKDAADQALAQAVQAKKPKAEIAALRKELTKQVGAVARAKTALRKHQKSLKDNAEERDRYTLRKYAREGILNLPKDVVEAMTKAGFTWGGDWAVHKDLMHFDMP